MLRLRPSLILARLLSTPSAAPVSQLHRLLSTAPAAVSPIHGFNAEEYLVGTCGLTGAQALRASTKISHVKSPANPDAVLAFLAGLGLSSTDVAAVVAKDPKVLCSAVEKTLSPVVTGLAGLGLTPDEITLLVSLAPRIFRYRSVVAKMRYYLPISRPTLRR
jgi:mTERF domain-containing protein